MKKIILSFIAILVSIIMYAQNSPVYVQNASGPNTCDGYAVIIDSTQIQNWEWIYPDSTVVGQNQGMIGNLCPGTYGITININGFPTTYTFVVGVGSGPDCSSLGLYVTVNQNASSPSSYDGSLTATAYGGTAPYSYTWSNGTATPTIDGLGVGSYQSCVTDANGCYTCTSGMIIADSVNNPCNSFYATVTTTNTTSPMSCDGTATVIPYGGTEPYYYQSSNNMLSSGNIVDLCVGGYYVIVTDVNGCSFTSQFYIGSDTNSTNYPLTAYTYTTNVSAEGQCDGSVYVEAYGGTAPYTFINSSGMVTGQYEPNLCEGVYSTIVTDAMGNTVTVNYFIASPDNVIDNGGFPDSTVVDTLSAPTLEDCLLDYLTLDTAYISNISFVGLDSIVVTWSFFDVNGVYDVLQGYSLNNGFGVYELLIEIFCPQRATDKYVIVKQNVLINESTNAISEVQSTDIIMYPNPVQDELTIALSEADQTLVSVTDVTGKIVYNNVHLGNLIHVNTSSFAKGQYVVNVSNRNNNFNRMIIK